MRSPKLPGNLLMASLAACLALSQAQAKSDLTGTWKLDLERSEFGPLPKPISRTDKVLHKDPDLKITTTQANAQGEFTFDLVYKTDGATETANQIGSNPLKSKAKWAGDVLVVDTKGSFNGNEFTMQEKFTVSGDGKTLTIDRHMQSQAGAADQKLIMVKQ